MNILMKRFVLGCVLGVALTTALSAVAAIDPGMYVKMKSTGTATYADGVTVKDGEWFILVWTAPGVTIDLTKDISGDVNSFLGDGFHWVAKKGASSGKCPTMTITRTNTIYQTGSIQLYLLDTRISATELAPEGTNKNGDSFPTVVNGVVPIEGATMSASTYWGTTVNTVTGPAPATSAWTILSKEVPIPVLVSMVFTNGVATVGATNTVSTANYCLKGSLDVTFTNTVWSCANQKGADDATTTLYFSDTDATNSAAFYRIEVVK